MTLRVGAGKASLNPTPDMFPFPTPAKSDWGLKPISEETTYDDMNCRAIAIDNGKDRIIFVSFELSGVPNVDDLYEAVAEASGFPKENVILIGTHNHTGYHDTDPRGKYEGVPGVEEWFAKCK